jgi:hypothetical protein
VQQAIVEFHATAVMFPGQAILFAVPNGELRDPVTAGILAGSRRARALESLRTDFDTVDAAETDDQLMRPAGLGVLPGANDLILLLPAAEVILIEVKAPKGPGHRAGRLSHRQMVFRRHALALGHRYVVLDTVDDYEALLRAKGVALRAGVLRSPRAAARAARVAKAALR